MKTSILLLILGIAASACSSSGSQGTVTKSAARAADENAALGAIRQVNEAQSTHFKLNRRYAITLEELVTARLLNAEPTAEQTGYDFRLRPAADAQTYRLIVTPSDASASSARRFFLDQTGVIRAEVGKEATAESPAVQ